MTGLFIFACLVCVGIWIFLIIYVYRRKNAAARSVAKNRNLPYATNIKHKSGLPIPVGATITLGYGDSGFVFIGNGAEITIAKEKIVDVDYFLKSSRSSLNRGAAHGRQTYGKNIGSAIGVASAMQYDFVITYQKDGKSKRVVFDAGAGNPTCMKIKSEFCAKNTKPIQKIEL